MALYSWKYLVIPPEGLLNGSYLLCSFVESGCEKKEEGGGKIVRPSPCHALQAKHTLPTKIAHQLRLTWTSSGILAVPVKPGFENRPCQL